MPNTTLTKYTLNFVERGQGTPIVFIHGMASSLRDWEHLTSLFNSQNYHTFALDLIGHGDSPKPDEQEAYHIEAIFSQFSTWLKNRKLEPSPVLVGHSLGGCLCLKYAYENPDTVLALILVNPFYSPNQLSPWIHIANKNPSLSAKAIQITPEWMIFALLGWESIEASNFPHKIRYQIAQDYKRASPHIISIPNTIDDLTPLLPNIHTPTLVIWGENDLSLNTSSFPKMVKLLPHAAGRCMSDCGHQPHRAKPKEFTRHVLEFLEDLRNT
ncbi:MAG: alpha/beta hydrolase [Chloroflexota bacterium]